MLELCRAKNNIVHGTGEQMNPEHLDRITDHTCKRELWMMQFIMIAPCFFIKMELDNDAYWLIQAGRKLLADGIPHVDPLSLHEGLHYVMQQWLTAGIFAFLYDSVGTIGILLLVLVIYITIVLIMFRLCLLISNGNYFISYIVTIISTIVLFFFMTTRPYPISMLIFLIEIYALESSIKSSQKRYLIALPILSLALINFHGAIWPFFFIIIVPYLIDSLKFKIGFIQGEGYTRVYLLLFTTGAFFVGFLNPYGWELMTYLFRSYGNHNISLFIQEMKSPSFQNATGLYFFTIFLFVIIALIQCRQTRLTLRYGLLMLGTAFMALSSMRNLSLFAICGLPMMAFVLSEIHPRINSSQKIRPLVQKILLISFATLVIGIFSFRLYESQFHKDAFVPQKAVAFILEEYQREDVRLFVGYNWGGYAEFMGLKPFIDARAEVFIKTNNKKADILDDLIA
jgi:hypothetical protein